MLREAETIRARLIKLIKQWLSLQNDLQNERNV